MNYIVKMENTVRGKWQHIYLFSLCLEPHRYRDTCSTFYSNLQRWCTNIRIQTDTPGSHYHAQYGYQRSNVYFPPLKKYIKIFRTWFRCFNMFFPKSLWMWVSYKMRWFNNDLLPFKYIIIGVWVQVYQLLKSAKEHLQHKLADIFSIAFVQFLREGFILNQQEKKVVICLLGYKKCESVAPKPYTGQLLLWRRHMMLSRNMWSLPSWLLQMCDVRALRERERSVLGTRLICPVGQVLRGARADTINLTLRANPRFPLQRNAGDM